MTDYIKIGWPNELKREWYPKINRFGRYDKRERDEIDKYRCGPFIKINDRWTWCNEGSGLSGHINGHKMSDDMLFCPYCGINIRGLES